MILRMQYSERMPYGPTSRRLMISVVVISVSEVSVAMSGDRAGLVRRWEEEPERKKMEETHSNLWKVTLKWDWEQSFCINLWVKQE